MNPRIGLWSISVTPGSTNSIICNRIYKYVLIYMIDFYICILYTYDIYNIFIYTYFWKKPIKILRFLYYRIINTAVSYRFFLPSVFFLIVEVFIFDIVYRAQGKTWVFYKAQCKLIQFQPYSYICWNAAHLYVKSLAHVFMCVIGMSQTRNLVYMHLLLEQTLKFVFLSCWGMTSNIDL